MSTQKLNIISTLQVKRTLNSDLRKLSELNYTFPCFSEYYSYQFIYIIVISESCFYIWVDMMEGIKKNKNIIMDDNLICVARI
jgi:hypothetical protein